MIKELKVYNVGEKLRIGNQHDGGYIVPTLAIENSKGLFSYGISNDISFDEHYIELTKNKVYAYDHTIDSIFTKFDNFLLHKEGLSSQKTDSTNNFIEHYKNNEIEGLVLLKIDIEGAEYEYFSNTNIADIQENISCIVVEFHDLLHTPTRNKFFDIIKKLNEYFYICHIHGNNGNTQFQYEEEDLKCMMPNVMEFTFISKSLVEDVSLETCNFPTELDNANNPVNPDFDLAFLK
jgi:hypothetical protein